MAQLEKLPNVVAVAARSSFGTRALIRHPACGHRALGRAQLRRPARRPGHHDQAAWPGPGPGRRPGRSSGVYSGKAGDTLRLQAADGSFRTVTVVGSARAMAFSLDTLDNRLVLYATQATVQDLGGFKGVNHLEFRLRDTSHSAAQATVAAVRSFLARQPGRTAFSDLPAIRAPGDWPAKSVFDQRSKVLDILTVLAVISAAFLLANTIRTMIAEQTGEIGVMRAIGASRRAVRHTYLRTAALSRAAGSGYGRATRNWAGLPAGGPLWPDDLRCQPRPHGRLARGRGQRSGWCGRFCAHGVANTAPGLRTPVREALNSEGLVSAFGTSRLDRAIVRSGALPPPVRVGLRNIARQKERSLTTIVQVALAVATLLGLVSLGQAVSQVTNQSWDVLDYDITLTAQAGGHDYGPAIVGAVRAQPGVAGVEAIDESEMSYRGQTLYALGVHATSFIHETLTAGRWLSAQDERSGAPVMVAGSAFARL